MYITFRDEIGCVSVDVYTDKDCGIVFDGENAYFSGTDGKDYKVSTKNIVLINNAKEA